MNRCVIALMLCLLFSGCQQRETNLALQTSDQAQEAAQKKLAQDIAPAVAQLPLELQEAVKKAVDDALLLLATSRDSIRPALALSQGNEAMPETRTTAEQAYQQPQEFARQAAIQTGRAHVEVEQCLSYVRAASFVAQYGQQLATDWLSLLLLGGGGAGLAGGVLVKGLQAFNSIKRAAKDAVEFGNDALAATKPEEIQAVKEKHKAIQSAHGTRNTIKQLGAKSGV